MNNIPTEILLKIQDNFHQIIRGRAGDFIDRYAVELPDLTRFLDSQESKGWLPVPGMYGGFSYWLEGEGEEAKLITESWYRVVGGSGQRHEITAGGSKLVDEGFV